MSDEIPPDDEQNHSRELALAVSRALKLVEAIPLPDDNPELVQLRYELQLVTSHAQQLAFGRLRSAISDRWRAHFERCVAAMAPGYFDESARITGAIFGRGMEELPDDREELTQRLTAACSSRVKAAQTLSEAAVICELRRVQRQQGKPPTPAAKPTGKPS